MIYVDSISVYAACRSRVFRLSSKNGQSRFQDCPFILLIMRFFLALHLPEDTTFGVRISGDSMEPEFHDGQIAWVLQQESVANWEIGIFALNGEAYIKKLQNDKDGIFLISLNEKYAPIKVSENDRLDIFGKVLGKSDASAITGPCRCYRIQHQNCWQDRTWGQHPICRIYAADIKIL